MRIEPLKLAGPCLLVPEPVEDSRGFFARSFSAEQLRGVGLDTDYPEWSLSHNRKRGTVRGLHWQAEPHAETKLVQCIRGAVFDVIVDVRRGSPTRGAWQGVLLSAENRLTLYVPAGFAHGYQTIADDTELLYHISETYRPELARGMLWNDETLGIEWPSTADYNISERDASLPRLAEIG
jgi:dTDP-4-dehydrorhamnose 3,5-epimerase